MENMENYPLIKNHWEPDFYCDGCGKGFYTLNGLEWHITDCVLRKKKNPRVFRWILEFTKLAFFLFSITVFILLFVGIFMFFDLFKKQLRGGLDWRINFFVFLNIWIWFFILTQIFR